jgi:SOS response regulatory protein OraA/RecX
MMAMKKISSDSISDWVTPEEREKSRLIQEGRIAVMTWIKLGRKSSGQIAGFLLQKGYPDDLIKLISASLADDRTIDDEALARKIIRLRDGNRTESQDALKSRLLSRGLQPEAITAAMSDHESDLSAAIRILSQKFTQLSIDESDDMDPESIESHADVMRKSMMKAGRLLISRGFDTATVEKALREFFPGIDSFDIFQA